ncbi:MAG: HAMP domain-containing protein [Chloroflexi bacterium]|nr:HAMP domain-containing protein [Chloroflexota bacterium]
MNRMWVRLSLTFTVVIIIAMASVGGVIRFTLETDDQFQEEVPPAVEEFLQQYDRTEAPINMTTFLIIVGSVAIIAGIGMSRSLTRPLRELEETAEVFSHQDLSQRVTVRGTKEVQAVAVQFNEMAERLEQEELLRRNLLVDVAHELRHPVHILQGNLQAILDDVYPLSKEEIARLTDQTRQLTTLIDDLHELAQAEAHQLPLQRKETDMAQLVKDTAASFKPGAAARQVELQVELLGTIPMLDVDASRIRQVLHNLLDNALRHTLENGRVLVTVEQIETGLQIKVADSGIGIEPEDLPHVFDRFYRADTTRHREQDSAGLGLAIVRAIIEAHDGRVSVTSPGLGQGSAFTLTLPSK